jgi:phospholipid transport system substrate-binding protein
MAGMAVAVAAVPAAASPLPVLKKRTGEVAALLKQETQEGTRAHERKKARMKRIIRSFFDYGELARRSLGIHWKDRSSAERKEFVALLRQLIEDRVLSSLTSHAEFTVEYGEVSIEGKSSSVKTVVRIPDKPEIEIEYKFSRRGSRWFLYDLVTDGTSLVRNYRSQFNRIIQRDGYQALVQKMRDKLNKNDTAGRLATAGIAG